MVWGQLAELRIPPIATTDFLYVRFIGDRRSINEKDFGKIQKDRVIEMKWADLPRFHRYWNIAKAKDLFNLEKYWGAHETLESVWKDAYHEEKDLLNGIILIDAAFVHDQKNESSICIRILSRAMKKLSQANGLYFGMNLDEIKRRVLQIIETGKTERFTI
jgi:hypothetical protein